MKIPQKLQVFDTDVSLSDVDEARLSIYLTGFMKLANSLNAINEPDLMRLIVMELSGKKRWKLLDRLLMRLGRAQRKRIEKRIRSLV